MNVNTGQILDYREVEKLQPEEQKKFVEVKRDLSLQEQNSKQISMYAPCGCGSGRKFKFCCHQKG